MADILIVDDHPAMAGAVAALIRSEGHRTLVAHDGSAALDRLRAEPIDLMVLDVMMPGMSGLDVLREVRAGRAVRTPPVIIYSGNDNFRDEAMRLGAVAFITKVDAHKLLALIDEHTQGVPDARGAIGHGAAG